MYIRTFPPVLETGGSRVRVEEDEEEERTKKGHLHVHSTSQVFVCIKRLYTKSCTVIDRGIWQCSHMHLHQLWALGVYIIKTQTLVTDKTKTYKSNSKAATFQRKIAASSGTRTHDL